MSTFINTISKCFTNRQGLGRIWCFAWNAVFCNICHLCTFSSAWIIFNDTKLDLSSCPQPLLSVFTCQNSQHGRRSSCRSDFAESWLVALTQDCTLYEKLKVLCWELWRSPNIVTMTTVLECVQEVPEVIQDKEEVSSVVQVQVSSNL